MKRLWIRKNLIFGIMLLTYVFAAFYISFFPLNYTATARVSFYPNAYKIENLDDIKNTEPLGKEIITEEIAKVTSENALDAIIKKWDLTKHPAYNHNLKKEKLINQLFNINNPRSNPDHNIEENIKSELLQNITVTKNTDSEIDITVTSQFPTHAQNISNFLAQLYIDTPNKNGENNILATASLPEQPMLNFNFVHILKFTFLGLLLGTLLALLPASKRIYTA